MLKGLLENFFVYNEHRYEVVQKMSVHINDCQHLLNAWTYLWYTYNKHHLIPNTTIIYFNSEIQSGTN